MHYAQYTTAGKILSGALLARDCTCSRSGTEAIEDPTSRERERERERCRGVKEEETAGVPSDTLETSCKRVMRGPVLDTAFLSERLVDSYSASLLLAGCCGSRIWTSVVLLVY